MNGLSWRRCGRGIPKEMLTWVFVAIIPAPIAIIIIIIIVLFFARNIIIMIIIVLYQQMKPSVQIIFIKSCLLMEVWFFSDMLHLHLRQCFNRCGRWGTTDDFTTSYLYFPLLSPAIWDLANSRPVHSLMLSSHLFFCLPCLPPSVFPRSLCSALM